MRLQAGRVQARGMASVKSDILQKFHQKLRGSLLLRQTANQTTIHVKPAPSLLYRRLCTATHIAGTKDQNYNQRALSSNFKEKKMFQSFKLTKKIWTKAQEI